MSHTLALTTAGEVWAWGLNSNGQLGNNDPANATAWSPVHVVGPGGTGFLNGIIAISAGPRASFAVKQDGTMYAWGYNAGGQLGTGTTTSPLKIPTLVQGISNVVSVAASQDAVLALKAEDSIQPSLWSWGDGNTSGGFTGRLFDGSQLLRTAPGRVGDALRIAGAQAQELALRHDANGQDVLWGVGTHFADSLSFGAGLSSIVPMPMFQQILLGLAPGKMISAAIRADLSTMVWEYSGARRGDGFSLGSAGVFNQDPDGDGLTSAQEWEFGTDPYNADTNGDGIPDGNAVRSGRSATNPDMDGDGVPNWVERTQGTDPFNPDTDGDGHLDGADCFPLDPTRWQCPSPTPGDTTPPTITLTEPTNATLISSNP
jgi:hypothetical protein